MAEAEAAEAVFEALTQAGSDDPDVMKAGEHLLLSWEETPGFIRTLAEIGVTQDLAVPPRLLAVVWLKTLIERHWRRDMSGPLPESERQAIRVCLLSVTDEAVDAIATQQALVIGLIARHELPSGWPDLLPTIVDRIQNSRDLEQQRGLTALYRVTKALASKRLKSAREMYRRLSVEMFPFLADLWIDKVDPAFAQVGEADSVPAVEAVAPQFDTARLILKLLRVLLGHGYAEEEQAEPVAGFLDVLLQRLGGLVDLRASLLDTGAVGTITVVEKCLVTAQKLMLDLHGLNPIESAPLLQLTLPFALEQIAHGRAEGRSERSVILAMNLVISVIRCPQFRAPQSTRLEAVFAASGAGGDAAGYWSSTVKRGLESIELSEKMAAVAYSVAEVLQPDVLSQLCETLVTQYLVLTESELGEWNSQPEEFAFDESGEAWKFTLRPASEYLYFNVVQQFGCLLGPVVAAHVESVLSDEPSTETEVLHREAAYTALSACAGEPHCVANELHDYVDFDSLFSNVLLSDLGVSAPEYTPIRRRALVAVGEWASVRFDHKGKKDLRSQLYAALVVLLSPEEDVVVRIAAMSTLREVMDDFTFRPAAVIPFLADLMPLLFNLLATVDECDSKMKVLSTLTLSIERVGNSHMQEYSNTLYEHLPGLWRDSIGDPSFGMLRTVVVRSLVKVVETLGAADAGFIEFLCDVIRFSVDDGNDDKVYLLDDGLALCHTMLQHSATLTESMVDVVASVLRLLDRGGEFVKVCLLIAESYVMLGGAEMLEAQGADLAAALRPLVGEVPPDGASVLCRLVDLIVCTYPEEGGALLDEVLITIIMNLLQFGDDVSSAVAGLYAPYMMVVSRLVLVNPALFGDLCGQIAENAGADPIGPLFDLWLDKFDAVVDHRWRKLSVLAMAAALDYPQFDLYTHPRFSLIVDMFVTCVYQFHILGKEELPIDFLVRFHPEDEEDDDDDELALATEPGRRREASRRDAVYTTNLRENISGHLAVHEARIEAGNFDTLKQSVDQGLLEQLSRFIDIP